MLIKLKNRSRLLKCILKVLFILTQKLEVTARTGCNVRGKEKILIFKCIKTLIYNKISD